MYGVARSDRLKARQERVTGRLFRLGPLPPGAGVSVRRAGGSTATFTVAAVAEYPR
jgi:hypothetical protein